MEICLISRCKVKLGWTLEIRIGQDVCYQRPWPWRVWSIWTKYNNICKMVKNSKTINALMSMNVKKKPTPVQQRLSAAISRSKTLLTMQNIGRVSVTSFDKILTIIKFLKYAENLNKDVNVPIMQNWRRYS